MWDKRDVTVSYSISMMTASRRGLQQLMTASRRGLQQLYAENKVTLQEW